MTNIAFQRLFPSHKISFQTMASRNLPFMSVDDRELTNLFNQAPQYHINFEEILSIFLPFFNVSDADFLELLNKEQYLSANSLLQPNELPTTDLKWVNKNKFSILQSNMQSLPSKLKNTGLQSDITEANLDLILCSEAWTENGNHTDQELHIPGYKFTRQDRLPKQWSTVCYYKEELSVINIDIPNEILSNLPCDILKIAGKGLQTFIICHIYRPHRITDWLQKYSNIIEYLSLNFKQPIIIAGDLNVNTLKDDVSFPFKLTNDMFNFVSHNAKPTRVTQHSKSCIDHIITNDNIINKCDTFIGWSDHFALVAELDISYSKRKQNKEFQFRSMKHFNQDEFIRDLEAVPWHIADTFEDINERFDVFWTLFEDIVNKHAPLKTVNIKDRKEKVWMTPELKSLFIAKKILRRDYVKGKEPKERWDFFNKYVKNEKRNAKRTYLVEKITENKTNPKKLWRILNEELGYKNSKESSCIESDEDAQDFCDHFVNLPEVVKHQLTSQSQDLNLNYEPWERQNINVEESFNFRHITRDTILNYFKKSSKRAVGVDGVGFDILKNAIPVISFPLTKLINQMIENSTFPDALKRSRISPIFKKGDKLDKGNYRPVSILPTLSKLFERILNDQFVEHAESNNLCDPLQSAYRKKHSTNTALLHMVDSWVKNMDNGKITGVLALDLSKAFDCISHNSILTSLKTLFKVNDPALKLFENYLSNRKTCIQSGPYKSQIRNVDDGVPQGSILGPTLFISALNDLKRVLPDLDYHIYADDLTIWTTGTNTKNIVNKLEEISHGIFKYFAGNGLKLNIAKTQFMYIGTSQKLKNSYPEPLNFLGTVVLPDESLKILGLTLDKNLNFQLYINSVINKCIGKLKFLWRSANQLPKEIKILLYNALVVPHLNYCDSVWDKALTVNLKNRLESIQNRGMKFICNKPRDYSSAALRRELKWITLENTRKLHYNSMIWQSVNGCAPSYLNEMFISTGNVHNYGTRERIHVRHQRRSLAIKSFSLRAPIEFNALQPYIRCSSSLGVFKSRMAQSFRTQDGATENL
jgi:exonuclease III